MQKEYGMESYGDRKTKKWAVITTWVVASLSILLVLYWAVAAPIVSRYLPHTGIYEDLDLYMQGDYLQFEDGTVFKSYVDSFDFDATAQSTYFYYVDNKREDNPIYGKVCDVYSIDIQLTQQAYEEYKNKLSLEKNYAGEYGAYVLYLSDEPTEKSCQGVVAFNDTKYIVRCILITDVNVEEYSYNSFVCNILRRKTSLVFE